MAKIIDSDASIISGAYSDLYRPRIYRLDHLVLDSTENTGASRNEITTFCNKTATCKAFSVECAFEAFKDSIIKVMEGLSADNKTQISLSQLYNIEEHPDVKRVVATGVDSYGQKIFEEFLIIEM